MQPNNPGKTSQTSMSSPIFLQSSCLTQMSLSGNSMHIARCQRPANFRYGQDRKLPLLQCVILLRQFGIIYPAILLHIAASLVVQGTVIQQCTYTVPHASARYGRRNSINSMDVPGMDSNGNSEKPLEHLLDRSLPRLAQRCWDVSYFSPPLPEQQ